jgi:hypothetical protein
MNPRLWHRALGIGALVLLRVGVAHAEDPAGAHPEGSAGAHPEGSAAKPDPDVSRARALFREARELAAGGKYDEACPKFEESLKLDDGMGTRFNLADCLEHRGRTASAQALFLSVADRAHAAGQTEREQVARDRAAALEPKLAHLVIDVPSVVPHLEISRDGAPVEPSSWGVSRAVDPGMHEIAATAPDHVSWSTHVNIEGQGKTLVVQVPKLDEKRSEPAGGSAPACKPGTEEPKSTGTETRSRRADVPSWVVPALLYGGVGTGVVLAGTSLVLYKRSNDEAKAVCPSSLGCSPADVQRHSELVGDARNMRTLAYVGLGLGGAALASAAVLTVLGSQHRESPVSRWNAGVVVAKGGIAAGMSGDF